jgi:glycosyltransferase involved in cell wall biosynthesis
MRRAGPVPVAIFLTSFDAGGTERQMIELACRLDRHRWHVHVVCYRATGAWVDLAASSGASITTFPVPSLRTPAVITHVRAFVRWCREHRIALLHTGQLYPDIFGLPAAALAGVPVRISNRRNLSAGKTLAQRAAQRVAQRFAHRIVANSEAAAERLRAEGIPACRVSLIRNGVDTNGFAPVPRPGPPRRVVTIANLRPMKGHDAMIDAVPLVLRHFPDATFRLVGDGPLLGGLRGRVRDRGVDESLTFVGHRDDVAAQLSASDIFVLPSRSESLPNAVLEAMAAGLPVIATAVGGIGEILEDGRTGLLVAPGDPAALADRICRLMAAPALAQALGTAARAEVTERYSFQRMVGAFDEVYRTELQSRGVNF